VAEQYHTIKLVDAPAWGWTINEVLKDINEFKPDLIVLDSSFPSLKNDLNVAKKIKQSFDVKTILVGPPCSQFTDQILQEGGVDIVAKYEYDFTITEIADTLQSAKSLLDIKGISYLHDGKIVHTAQRPFSTSKEITAIPFVSKIYKKYLNSRQYFLGQSLYPEVQIFTGRGCPNFCTFCLWPQTFMGRIYRVRSVENVVDELEWIQKNMPEIKEVFFEDDTFTVNSRRVLDFCKAYQARGLKITWACNARADLPYETMKAMKKAHCRLLIIGYESGSNEILKTIRKGVTIEQGQTFAKNARKANLLTHGDFIIGLPGETKETIELTRKQIKATDSDLLQVSVASPFPGTEFYDWARSHGYLITDDPTEYLDKDGHQKSIVSYPWLTADEITKEVDAILKDYYLSPRYIPKALRQVLRRNSRLELARILRSTKGFSGYMFKRKSLGAK
jgi:radical SAM superfamily enzyme YgiQ (UPF0313 family)